MKSCRFASSLCVLASLLAGGSAFAADVKLKASHQWNNKDVRHQMVQIIADEAAKAGVGLEVQVYPSKSLYKPKEQWTPLTRGQLAISAFPLAYAASRHPEFDATLMPGLVKNHDHAAKLNDSDFMQDIKKIINDAGVMVLSDTWLAGGFSSKKNCILEPDDVKGQVTRAAGKAFEQMMAGAGASIASMPSSEIYTAMQTGVLDAANTSSGSFVSYRIYEQVKCLTAPGEHALWFMYEPILMSKKVFDGLTKEQQDVLLAAGQKAEEFFDAEARKLDKTLEETFKKAGVEVVTMNAEQAAKWREIAKTTSYAEFIKKVPSGKSLIDKALAAQ